MKKYVTILSILLYSIAYSQAPTLNVRNSVLGIYTGTYIEFANWPNLDTVAAGVKITALPNDTTGVITHDTLNNTTDTMYLGYWYDVFQVIVDTAFQPCGDLYPAKDSIFYSRCVGPSGNPIAEYRITCVQHTFPTNINEDAIYTNIFPNPASTILRIINNKNSINGYAIYNSVGQIQVKDSFITINEININIENLSQGFYYIKIKTIKGETIKSFIKN